MADYHAAMIVKIDNSDPHSQPVRIVEIDSETLLVDSNGREIKILELVKRLEQLEAAYIEDKLLGSDPGIK